MNENKDQSSAGFTLIEVIVALTIAGLVFTALSSSFLQITYTQQQLTGRVTALILGEGKLAELTGGSEPSMSGDFPSPYQKFKWLAAEEKVDGGKEITLTVEWRDKNAIPHQSIFTGYRDSD